jgi:uncharacterized protein
MRHRPIVARLALCTTLLLGFFVPAAAQPSAPEHASPVAEEISADTRILDAAMQGSVDGIRSALARGSSVEAVSDSGATPLSAAAVHGHVAAVQALLEAGANVGATDNTGATALMFAAAQGHASTVDLLLSRGADVNARDKTGVTALMMAASSGRSAGVRALIKGGADVNAVDKQGASALMAAAYGGHAEAGSALIAGSANVNLRDESGRTALMATSLGGSTAMTASLIAAKADLNAEDLAGSTALTYAASSGHAAVVEQLLKAGLTKGADAAVSFAIRGCHTDIVKTLRANGAAIDRRIQGMPTIVIAAASNCPETLTYLLDSGGDVNAPADEDGRTPLMAAAERGLVSIGEILIARGADANLRNKQDQTAWYYAAMNKHQDFIELLRKERDKP